MSATAIERKNALALFPYFNQKHPVVFDVGSNKGTWADIFVHNVGSMWLVEPNEILRHYTQVRYDYLTNVYYLACAASYKSGYTEFIYFENHNNGLSNIVGHTWPELPMKKRQVYTETLDNMTTDDEEIDFIKIDVEGAELHVLSGAYNLLHDKRIKFIQVERAEHIHYAGKTFQDIVDYLSTFGYSPIETEDTENVIFAMEGFTQDWNTEFKKNTAGMKFDFALEIGCFEGLTSRYICDNLLNPGGRVICVDPLTDEYLPGHPDNHMFVGQYDRFTRNTRNYPIELIRKKSSEVYDQLKDYRFQFIYVDGDHTEEGVYNDAYLAFNLCLPGGKILFDDYLYREETKRGIDRFLRELPTNKMTYKDLGYQIMVTKHENLI